VTDVFGGQIWTSHDVYGVMYGVNNRYFKKEEPILHPIIYPINEDLNLPHAKIVNNISQLYKF